MSNPPILGQDNGVGYGVEGTSTNGTGVRAAAGKPSILIEQRYPPPPPPRAAVYAQHYDTGWGVFGASASGPGVFGESASAEGVHGKSFGTAGVVGECARAYGMQATGSTGIVATGSGIGVWAISNNNDALFATTGSGTAVHAHATNGRAGFFQGDVEIAGNLSKSGGGFKIDHPLDPANKYLVHSFVESDERKNVYDGAATLNAKGEAEVRLPKWFDALNGEVRYQLTAIGAPAPNLHVARGVRGNAFRIAGGKPKMKVCWQVTAARKDKWAKANPLSVEEKKTGKDRGRYLHPRLQGKPEKLGIGEARRPEAPAPGQGTGGGSEKGGR